MLCKFQNIRIRECTLMKWYSKPNIRSTLETLLIFTPIPLDAQEVWSLNQLYVYVLERMKESPTLTYIPIHVSCCSKNSVCFSPNNWLSNWANLLGISNWALICGLEWDQKGTNKTLAPIGLGLFCQLLTSPKLPLIIFNTTI